MDLPPPPTPAGDLVRDSRVAPFSSLGDLSDDDVNAVWIGVCSFINRSMAEKKGVHILGLGTFAWCNEDPAFILSEKFAARHRVRAQAKTIDAGVPVHHLNYTAISSAMSHDREVVEACVHELLMALEHRAGDEHGISLEFHNIGCLSVRGGKVRFRFFRTYLADPFNADRPVTRSVSSRAATVGHYGSRQGLRSRDNVATPRLLRTPNVAAADLGLTVAPPGMSIDEDDEEETGKTRLKVPGTTRRIRTPEVAQGEVEAYLKQSQRGLNTTLLQPYEGATSPARQQEVIEKLTDWQHGKGPVPTILPPLPRTRSVSASPPVTPGCGHKVQGKMCYACFQRSKSQQDPAIVQEIESKEIAATQAMLDVALLQERKGKAIERMAHEAKRDSERRTAEFNLSASLRRTPTSEPSQPMADVLLYRPRTSPAAIMESKHQHGANLRAQVVHVEGQRRQRVLSEQEEDKYAQEALQAYLRESARNAIEQKHARTDEYRAALDAQVEERLAKERRSRSSLDLAVTDDAVDAGGSAVRRPHVLLDPKRFAEEDRARLQRTAEFASTIKKEVLTSIHERDRKAKEEQARELDVGRENVQYARHTLREDTLADAMEALEVRFDLESDWREAARRKKEREQEYEAHRLAAAPMTLLQQTDPYDRCNRCQRDPENSGTLNIDASSVHVTTRIPLSTGPLDFTKTS